MFNSYKTHISGATIALAQIKAFPAATHAHGDSEKHSQLTRHIDLYQSRTRANAIGGITDVGSSKLIGHWAFEEQGVVLDFNIVWKRSIQPEKSRKIIFVSPPIWKQIWLGDNANSHLVRLGWWCNISRSAVTMRTDSQC